MCLFSHEWKVKSTEDIKPLAEQSELIRKAFNSGSETPFVYFERKLKVLRECARCGEEQIQIVRVDP